MAKYRTFEICSQPPYLDEGKILKALEHKNIAEWAYICHDKDTYTEKQLAKICDRLYKDYDDIKSDNIDEKHTPRPLANENETREEYVKRLCPYNVGDLKPLHWHCYIVLKCPLEVRSVAKWFDTAPNNVEVKSGAGAFVDCLEYAVHDTENAKNDGKYPYSWEELRSNIDARERVENKRVRRMKYGKDLNEKDALRMRVLNDGMSLYEASEKYPVEYAADISVLSKLRGEYLARRAPLPKQRFNFYFTGGSSMGKDVMCRAFARQMFPDITDDAKLFHVVNDLKTPFEGYDGQPIIIWSDIRAGSLISAFTRSGFYSLIDSTPTRGRRNIKYGSVVLNNTFNFFNGIETYPEFLNGLAGKDDGGFVEPKKQAYRRFPFIVPIYADYFQLLINYGWVDGYSYEQYKSLCTVTGNLAAALYKSETAKKIAMLPEDEQKVLREKIEDKFLQSPLAEVYKFSKNNETALAPKMAEVLLEVEKELANVRLIDSPEVLIEEHNALIDDMNKKAAEEEERKRQIEIDKCDFELPFPVE